MTRTMIYVFYPQGHQFQGYVGIFGIHLQIVIYRCAAPCDRSVLSQLLQVILPDERKEPEEEPPQAHEKEVPDLVDRRFCSRTMPQCYYIF